MNWLLQCPEGQRLALTSGTDILVGSDDECALRLRGPGVPARLGVLSGTQDDVWLRIGAGEFPVGVNGRPVRALSRLVAGDRVCFGTFCVDLQIDPDTPVRREPVALDAFALRVRNGIGAGHLHHGPVLHLDADGEVVPATAGRIALSLKDGRIRLAPGDQSVRINGHPAVSDVELVVTDQVHVGTRRYLVEGVSTRVPEPVTVRMAAMSESMDDDAIGAPARGDRGALWWLIAIAGLIAALVSALLYYHG
jgi:hypothetical protein